MEIIEKKCAALIDFARPKKHGLPKEKKRTSFADHYSFNDPTTCQQDISKESFKDLYSFCPDSAVFNSLDVSQLRNEETVNQGFVIMSRVINYGSDTDSDTIMRAMLFQSLLPVFLIQLLLI